MGVALANSLTTAEYCLAASDIFFLNSAAPWLSWLAASLRAEVSSASAAFISLSVRSLAFIASFLAIAVVAFSASSMALAKRSRSLANRCSCSVAFLRAASYFFCAAGLVKDEEGKDFNLVSISICTFEPGILTYPFYLYLSGMSQFNVTTNLKHG